MSDALTIARPAPGVVLLTLDRPPVNALDPATLDGINACLDELETDMSIRVAILTGRGTNFCAGADVRALARAQGAATRSLSSFGGLISRIEALRVPVIGALNGACAGGGLELALACDIRIGTPDTAFIAAGVSMGLMSGTLRLPRLIGMGNAALMLMTGSRTDAETALRFGLISELVAADTLLARCTQIAERIATRAPLSVEANKRVLRGLADQGEQSVQQRLAEEVAQLARSNDHRLAVEYFGTGKPPPFGRS